MPVKIKIPHKKLSNFCQRWKVKELALFGSVLSENFRPDSDIDVLISFSPEAPWSLFDLIEMQEELQRIFRREVDIVEREALINPFRRKAILSNYEVIYAS
jgi:predicted nucleotidyltransferase